MSNKLLKILAICIFATLIPVAVVAIAMAATMSAPYTVAVELKVDQEAVGSYPKEISISVNDKARDGSSVGVKAGDEVTISFSGNAYDVEGFYAGNSSSVNESSQPLTERGQATYSFTVADSATITVWANAKTFDVSYVDAEGTPVAKAETLIYGAELEVMPGANFAGWQVVSAPDGVRVDNTIYTQATFSASGDYTLNPVYQEFITINYYDGDTLIAQDTVYQTEYEAYALRGADDEKVIEAVDAGYAFVGWENNIGDAISDVPAYVIGEEYNLYLAQETISYTADVKFHKNSDQTTELTFNVENGFAQYQTRENYTLAGFEYDGTLYNYTVVSSGVIDYVSDLQERLSFKIAQTLADSSTHAQLTAVWDADTAIFKGFENNFSFIFVPTADGNNANINVMLPGGELQALEQKEEYGITFGRDEEYDLNQTLYSFLTGSDDAIVYGPNGETANCDITYLIDAVGGDPILGGFTKTTTFAEFIKALVVYDSDKDDVPDYIDRAVVYINFNFS